MRLMGALVLFTVLGFVGSAWADGAYVNSDGYWVYPGNHYYWKGNDAYARVQVAGYYSYGHYYPPTYRYQFSHTYRTPAYTAPATPEVGWRTKLLDIAAARDKAEAKIRFSAFEQQYYLEALNALGLKGNFHWNGYGQSPPYPLYHYGAYGPAYGNLQLSTAGAQGQTVYGYSYNSIASLYGDANLNTLFQQAGRLTENAQKLAGQATTDFSALVGQEGGNRAKIAEILAKGQAVREFLQAIQGSASKTETRIMSFKVGPDGNGGIKAEKVDPPQIQPMPPVDGGNGGDTRAAWQAHASAKCGSCHSGKRIEGGFEWRNYPAMSVEQKLVVVGRLLHTDPGKRMPKDGPPLTVEEKRLWLTN